ncbi:hypothetical protein [Tychonema sp. LEGE 06208]|uniref:hypothetical protein n=1 Tax=Tychonema sp. LEGE 06208 TaxID=1828663 RepID=UPI0019E56DDE|nr:hypothetical protein [Tychonema sp. LEGE 06208]MBE9162090.1 hypothetical protein [Tychonema sp. LEGE 06208]
MTFLSSIALGNYSFHRIASISIAKKLSNLPIAIAPTQKHFLHLSQRSPSYTIFLSVCHTYFAVPPPDLKVSGEFAACACRSFSEN